MEMKDSKIKTSRECGFTLLETMVTLAILIIVFAVVMNGIMLVQQRNTVEINKVDLTQETRQFMDQITNDIHQAGFPTIRMFDPVLAYTTTSNQVAAGLTYVSANEIDFQGDVDGSGTVSDVVIRVIPAGGPCPCTIQRGTVAKTVGGVPVYYTELDNLQNASVFTAYGSDGSSITLPVAQDLTGVTLKNINAIGITLWVQSATPDPKTGAYPTVTMVSQAKLDNNNW
ncbi:MAG: type II secretion system protein [Candidatus Acidiferrales bacterium]